MQLSDRLIKYICMHFIDIVTASVTAVVNITFHFVSRDYLNVVDNLAKQARLDRKSYLYNMVVLRLLIKMLTKKMILEPAYTK